MFCLPPGWDDLHPGRRREHFHRQDFSSHRHQTLHLYCSHHLTLRLIIIMARLFISTVLIIRPASIAVHPLFQTSANPHHSIMHFTLWSLLHIDAKFISDLTTCTQSFAYFSSRNNLIFSLTGQHIEPSLSQADPSNATYFSFIIISLVLFSFLALFTCLGCCGAAYKSGCMLGRSLN